MVLTRHNRIDSMLRTQKAQEWHIDGNVPWTKLDVRQPLMPTSLFRHSTLTENEWVALAQLLGLMSIAAISQHEAVMGAIEQQSLNGVDLGHESAGNLKPLLDQFFREESKHSEAFARYIELFAKQKGIDLSDLKRLLPQLPRTSWITRGFLFLNWLGGNAIWHLVQMTELESIDLYRFLLDSGANVEPLFLELNRLHYEEEVRHISVPALVLQAKGPSPARRLNLVAARLLHSLWAIGQFRRLYQLRRLRHVHPFFAELYTGCTKLSFRLIASSLTSIHSYVLSGRRLRHFREAA